jgi:excisionase family DNA binding protein
VDELLTTRELQNFLRVDRTTIYNLLNEGQLPGFKVGGQWRFSRQEIEAWLWGQRAEAEEERMRPSSDALPRAHIQSIQTIFAKAMEVGSVVTRLDGQPLTQISNSSAFCDLVLGTPEGFRRCVGSWRALSNQQDRKPQLLQCHAGLLYARSRIEVEDEFVAMAFAGQIVVNGAKAAVASRVHELAAACELDPAQLRRALTSAHLLTAERAQQLISLLEQVGETLSGIGQERLLLLRKLCRIAEITAL